MLGSKSDLWLAGRMLVGQRPGLVKALLLAMPVIAALVIASCSGRASSSDRLPEFEIRLFENANHRQGEVLRLSDLEGRPVVVNFWFPSCPPCVAEMPDLEKAFQKYRGQGVEFVGIQLVGLDSVEDGQEFVERLGVSYALGPDEKGDIIKEFQIAGFPTTVFADRDHRIVRTWTGTLNEEKLDEIMQQVLP